MNKRALEERGRNEEMHSHPAGDVLMKRQHDQMELSPEDRRIGRVVLQQPQLLVAGAAVLVVEDTVADGY